MISFTAYSNKYFNGNNTLFHGIDNFMKKQGYIANELDSMTRLYRKRNQAILVEKYGVVSFLLCRMKEKEKDYILGNIIKCFKILDNEINFDNIIQHTNIIERDEYIG